MVKDIKVGSSEGRCDRGMLLQEVGFLLYLFKVG